MAEEKQKSRIRVEDLPAPEKELTPDEQKAVQGGGYGLSGRSQAVQDGTSDQKGIVDGTSNQAGFADGSVRS